MRVCCRFAPPSSPAAHSEHALLRLRVEGEPCLPPGTSTLSSSSPSTIGTRVYAADPVTLSKAAFSCDAIFLPPSSLCSSGATCSASPSRTDAHEAIQQQQQLYAITCRGLLHTTAGPLPSSSTPASSSSSAAAAAQRRIYLAYGQTASGKTYTLFGEAPALAHKADEVAPTAGVVPRFLFDVFHAPAASTRGAHRRTANSFVDISCFEVYNEVTTDLVALASTLMAADAPPPPRNSSGGGGGGAHSGRRASTSALACDPAPVWAACQSFHAAQEERGDEEEERNGDGASSTAAAGATTFFKTEYKTTEKQQVLRCVERARCASFAEAQTVLRALLSLRQECATSRNQSSSRGHLVVRVETYTPALHHAGWVLQHETAFVDLAGSESGRPAEGDMTTSELTITPAATALRRRGRPSAPVALNGSFTAGSRASSQHSRTSHDTSVLSAASSQRSCGSGGGCGGSGHRSAAAAAAAAYHRYLLHPASNEDEKARRVRRQRETRCINASLLALRKVFRALYEATAHLAAPPSALGGGDQRNSRRQQQQQQRPPLHHAPFKDSALTAILEPFLIPQPTAPTPPPLSSNGATRSQQQQQQHHQSAHVVLLVCCSSRSEDFFESVATLRLGAEATAVNPEVVLRALPVQRREQQQQQQQNGGGCASSVGHAGRGVRQPGRVSGGLHPLVRSASAPNQRLLLGRPRSTSYVEDDEAAPHRKAAAAQLPAPSPPPPTASAEEVEQLRAEVHKYKAMAQQLYNQCKSLCTSYDECVDELGRCRAALTAKEEEVVALEAQMAAMRANVEGAAAVTPATTAATTVVSLPTPPRVAEESSSPAARSPASASPTHHTAHQQQQLQRLGRRVVLRGPSASSAAREESARCLVSVSPFSTASLTVAGSVAQHVEEVEEGRGDVDGVEAGDAAAANKAQKSSTRSSDFFSLHDVNDVPTAAAAQSRSLQQQQPQQEKEKARSIMDTLLARQIFPAAATAASSSPLWEGSPSPLLPALSAHHSPVQPAGPSCERSPTSSVMGSGGATASSDEQAAKRSRSAEEGGGGDDREERAVASTSPLAQEENKNSSTRAQDPSQVAQSNEHGTKDEAEELEEVVISFRGSPAGQPSLRSSEGSTRRSRSTAYTALMPPSPSRSPVGSRSASPHETLIRSRDVYRL